MTKKSIDSITREWNEMPVDEQRKYSRWARQELGETVSSDSESTEDAEDYRFVPRSSGKKRREDEVYAAESSESEFEPDIEEEEEEEEEEMDEDVEETPVSRRGAFLQFRSEQAKALKKERKFFALTPDIQDEIREQWFGLTPQQKQVYKDQAAEERIRCQILESQGKLLPKPKRVPKKARVEERLRERETKTGKGVNRERWQSYMSLPTIIDLYTKRMTPEQLDWIEHIGLGGLRDLRIEKTDEGFNKFIYQSYDPARQSVVAHGREYKITDETVSWLLGISCEGEILEAEGTTIEDVELAGELGITKSYLGVKEKYYEWFKLADEGQPLTDEWKRRSVIYILSLFGMPHARLGIRQTLVKYVKDLERLENVNWAGTFLECLRQQHIPVKREDKIRGAGCLTIPMLVYLEKFVPKYFDQPQELKDMTVVPRLRVWNQGYIRCRWNFLQKHMNKLVLSELSAEDDGSNVKVSGGDGINLEQVMKMVEDVMEKTVRKLLNQNKKSRVIEIEESDEDDVEDDGENEDEHEEKEDGEEESESESSANAKVDGPQMEKPKRKPEEEATSPLKQAEREEDRETSQGESNNPTPKEPAEKPPTPKTPKTPRTPRTPVPTPKTTPKSPPTIIPAWGSPKMAHQTPPMKKQMKGKATVKGPRRTSARVQANGKFDEICPSCPEVEECWLHFYMMQKACPNIDTVASLRTPYRSDYLVDIANGVAIVARDYSWQLARGVKLGDTMIDCLGHILHLESANRTDGKKKTWFIPCFYAALGQANMDGVVIHRQHLGDVNEVGMIVLPLNITDTHYLLMVLEMETSQCYIMDPLSRTAASADHIRLKLIQMQDNLKLTFGAAWKYNISNWNVVWTHEDVPRQPNDIDCGPYICWYMANLEMLIPVPEKKVKVMAGWVRVWLANYIGRSVYNVLKEKLLDDLQEFKKGKGVEARFANYYRAIPPVNTAFKGVYY